MSDERVRETLAEVFEAIYEEVPVSPVHVALVDQIVAGLSRFGYGISEISLDVEDDDDLLDMVVVKSEILGDPETDEALPDDETLPDEDEFGEDDKGPVDIIITEDSVEVLLLRRFPSLDDSQCVEKVCRLVVGDHE